MIRDAITGRAIGLAERGMAPDAAVRAGIRALCRKRLRSQRSGGVDAATFARRLADAPIADVPEKANEQHYEVPAEFYALVLGEHLKYSGCLWPDDCDALRDAEAHALRATCEHAELGDGQRILELGCGWGSLTLWMAARYPGSEITAVSNSSSQRAFIEGAAAERGLRNVRVLTRDMNVFEAEGRFDRIVSVEMFEHMSSWRRLLERVSGWLEDDGRMLIHVFCHRDRPYRFEPSGPSDWMATHFFSGGIMPSADLFGEFGDILEVEDQWHWNGVHYARTAEAWLSNMDRNRDRIMPILAATYGASDAGRWFQRWRIFFMACAELFGMRGGDEWFVTHCRLRRAGSAHRFGAVSEEFASS